MTKEAHDKAERARKAFRNYRRLHGDFRTDEEVRNASYQSRYYTKEEAAERIKQLEAGPPDYPVEHETTSPSIITREEMIARVKRLTQP